MFFPSHVYVQQSILQPEVLGYLARHWYRKSVYMVVGIKVGCEAEIIHRRQNDVGGQLNGSIPGALTGIPIDMGAEISSTVVDSRYEQKSVPSSFVFAYRLREIRYFKKDSSTRDTEFTKGADLHHRHGKTRVEVRPAVEDGPYLGTAEEIEIAGMDVKDFEEDEDDSMVVDGCVMVGSSLN